MEDYPDDPKWWLKASSSEDFCEKAGFGPLATSMFIRTVNDLGGTTKDSISVSDYAEISLNSLLRKTPMKPALAEALCSDLDQLVKTWVLLQRKYDSLTLPISAAKDALDLIQSTVISADPEPRDYTKAALAFQVDEKPTASGEFASDGVFAALLNQRLRYRGGGYLSPYTTIVGPSGVGKSFSVRQLAVRHGLYVVYSNLSSSTSRGYPRPVMIGPAVPSGGKREAMISEWKLYLEDQFKIVDWCKEAKITAPGLFELFTSQNKRLVSAREQLESCFIGRTGVPMPADDLETTRALLEELGLNAAPTLPCNADDDPPIIICFDEARALLNNATNSAFRNLRRAAKQIAQEIETSQITQGGGRKPSAVPFFLVLLDTTSKISNFTPLSRYDSSAKATEESVFNPIFEINSLDVFVPHDLEDPSGTATAVEQLFSHGRPLWGAFLQAGHSWDSLLQFAIDKIRGYKQQDHMAYHLALLTYRMNFSVCSPALAEELVASMMRYLISVSIDRNSLITTQPSEPVLAFASSCLLQDPSTRLSCIRAWVSCLHSGAVNPGDIGEQVASIILLFAFDHISEPKDFARRMTGFFSSPEAPLPVAPTAIPLNMFMEALVGDVAWLKMRHHIDYGPSTIEILDTGRVFFNHFIRAATTPTRAMLENAYKRGAALFMPPCFPGMDVAIPVRVPAGGELALLFIQIKNRQDDVFTPGLTMYMREALQKAEKALDLNGELYGILGLVMCLRTLGESGFSVVTSDADRTEGPMTRSTSTSSTGGSSSRTLAPFKVHTKAKAKATGKGKRKGKGKAVVDQHPESEPARLIGMAFGLDTTVYPCMRAPGASVLRHRTVGGDKRRSEESEEICDLLADLLKRWPNAYSDEDTRSEYAKKLLDPFFGLTEAKSVPDVEEGE